MTEKITPLGDMHSGGQTQLIENDKYRYIKKPRDFKTEAAFSSFCNELAKLGLGAFSRSTKLIECDTNYHTEEIEENTVTTDEGIDLYYKRAGILMFVCYLLFSEDLHCENVIACGDMPVVVDLETLLSGKIARSSKTYNLTKSVLCSHLLCDFISHKKNTYDISGFSGTNAGSKNIPHTSDGKVFVWQKTEELISGFENAYNVVLSHKDDVAKLIHLFDNCNFRQILRPTQTYSILSDHIKSTIEAEKESVAYTLLAKAYEKDIDKTRIDKAADILSEEVRAVISNEIPLFHTLGNSCDLLVDGKTVMKDFLELSPVDYAIERLEGLSSDDLERQIKIIRLAVSASEPLGYGNAIYINKSSLAPGEISAQAVSNAAVPGFPSVFCELNSSSATVNLLSCGYSLYSGLIGFLCMYAALYRKTEKKEYLDLLFRYYQNFSDMMLTSNRPVFLTDSIASLSEGVAGMISGLLHISDLIEDKSFKKAAEKLADRIVISESLSNPDYLNGVGALPLVLSRFENKKIVPLCEHLNKTLKDITPFTTGLAHGASGLMLTFAVINKYIPQDNLLAIADWEEKQYRKNENNWYDLRDKTKTGFMSGWCSGAPGIGMARNALKDITDDTELLTVCYRDIERTKEFLTKETPCKKDSLCCGTASRLMAASRLDIKTGNLYNQLVEAEKRQNLRLTHVANTNDIKVSLMQGLAGVAYALAMYGDSLSGGMTV